MFISRGKKTIYCLSSAFLLLGVALPYPTWAANGTRQFVPLVKSNQLTPVSKGIASGSQVSVSQASISPSGQRFIPLNNTLRPAGGRPMISLNGGKNGTQAALKPLSTVPRVEKKTVADVSDEVKLAMASGEAKREQVSAALAPLVKGGEAALAPLMRSQRGHGQTTGNMAEEAESMGITEADLETDLDIPEAAMLGVADMQPEPVAGRTRHQFVWPIAGDEYTRISSAFGARRHPVTGERDFHAGIDIPAPIGTKVLAALEGEVTGVGEHPRLGRYVKITHADGTYSLYGHLSRYTARSGDRVKGGQVIGMVGSTGRSTGPHLDFSIRRNGKPINPMPLLAKALEEKKLALAD